MLSPNTNLLLSALSSEARELLLSNMIEVELPLRTVLFEPEETPNYAYFMTSGIASIVIPMENGGTAEVEVVGREGIAGCLPLLSAATNPTSCFMQLSGSALRIRLTDLRSAFRSSEEIRGRILELIHVRVLTISQIAACNRLHEAEERLARWLLMVQDRTQSEVLNITQEFLAEMLGAQRTTVTLVAGSLQRSGLIEYQRGRVKINNREALEAAACECYQNAKKLYRSLYGLGSVGS
jgi:CRP-like cAMP-binding protein